MGRLHIEHCANFFVFLLLSFLCSNNLAGVLNLNKLVGAVKRQADSAALFTDSFKNALANPPYGIRNEVVALGNIKFIYSSKESKVSFADEV